MDKSAESGDVGATPALCATGEPSSTGDGLSDNKVQKDASAILVDNLLEMLGEMFP